MVALAGLIARALEQAERFNSLLDGMRSTGGHPYHRKQIKRAVPRSRWGQPSGGRPVSEGVCCHLGGKARPSSFALGNGRGSNGQEPGVKGPRVPFVPNARWTRAKARRDRKQAR